MADLDDLDPDMTYREPIILQIEMSVTKVGGTDDSEWARTDLGEDEDDDGDGFGAPPVRVALEVAKRLYATMRELERKEVQVSRPDRQPARYRLSHPDVRQVTPPIEYLDFLLEKDAEDEL